MLTRIKDRLHLYAKDFICPEEWANLLPLLLPEQLLPYGEGDVFGSFQADVSAASSLR